MIYIITVHHETNRFLDIQSSFINKYSANHEVVCGYYGFEQCETIENYHLLNLNNFHSKEHSVRMNYLYEYCLNNFPVKEDDIIVFMDSDAFPISLEWISKIKSYLSVYPLTAIQRKENIDKPMPIEWQNYPHPSFCAVVNKFWIENQIKWDLNLKEKIYTPGITLKIWLDKNKVEWKPLLRTNVINTHPLLFGVYDDIIYHHGCGNRPVFDGVDIWTRPKILDGPDIDIKYPVIVEFNKSISEIVINEIEKDYRFISIYYLGINPDNVETVGLGEYDSIIKTKYSNKIKKYIKRKFWQTSK